MNDHILQISLTLTSPSILSVPPRLAGRGSQATSADGHAQGIHGLRQVVAGLLESATAVASISPTTAMDSMGNMTQFLTYSYIYIPLSGSPYSL